MYRSGQLHPGLEDKPGGDGSGGIGDRAGSCGRSEIRTLFVFDPGRQTVPR
jgi:hypothetical protein